VPLSQHVAEKVHAYTRSAHKPAASPVDGWIHVRDVVALDVVGGRFRGGGGLVATLEPVSAIPARSSTNSRYASWSGRPVSDSMMSPAIEWAEPPPTTALPHRVQDGGLQE
jgi:hypothetical protein